MDNFDKAEKFYQENKEQLLETLLRENTGRIDYQYEYNQCAVWFDGFTICYQSSDMNGEGGMTHSNEGASEVYGELGEIIKSDTRMNALYADGEVHDTYFVNALIDDFCWRYAELNDISLDKEDDPQTVDQFDAEQGIY